MSLFRATTLLSSSRSFIARPTSRAAAAVSFSTRARLNATQGYGSGDGDPKGEQPQKQGASESEHLEHPGPAPPKAGQGSGAGPTKGGEAPSGSSSSSSKETTSSSSSGSSKGTQGAQPKILSESPPQESEASEDVKQHNRDMDQRAEQAHEKVQDQDHEKDKVSKDFWKGQGGRDSDP